MTAIVQPVSAMAADERRYRCRWLTRHDRELAVHQFAGQSFGAL